MIKTLKEYQEGDDMKPFDWDDMDFWKTGEWDVVQERLDDLDKKHITYNPARENLFAALDATPFDEARVMIVGQDPYPDPSMATGLAFSIPKKFDDNYQDGFPPTLKNILLEYSQDLHYPASSTGDLTKWASQGVLLWNAIPTCLSGQPLSHEGWSEWSLLTEEIIKKLDDRHIVFAFLGRVARNYTKFVNTSKSDVIETSHPSPRGQLNSSKPFVGSRLFTTINAKLVEQGLEKIDWRL